MTLPLRPNVCILLFNSDQKLFLGERKGDPNHWQFPQGGAEDDLSLEGNVLRELEEELGISPEKLKVTRKLHTTYEYDWDKPREFSNVLYRGQSQTFWLVAFLGEDSDINIETAHPEFMSWRWCSPHEVRTEAYPVRLPSYIKPLREYEDYLMLADTGLLPERNEED